MSAHTIGGILLFIFGVLLIVVGAVFYKPNKTDTYNGVVHIIILALGGLLVIGGSAWFWTSLGL